MAATFSYNDYFKNNANAQIPSSSTVPTTSSTVPTMPVSYSQFVSPPTYTPPSLTPTPAPNPTPTPTPSTGYGAVMGQYGTTTPTSAGKGTGGSTITYSSGLGGDVTGGSEGGGLKIQRVSEVLTGSNGVTGEYSIGGVIGSTIRKFRKKIKELLDGDGTPTIEISEDGYLVIDGVKTEYQVPGKNGADGNGGNDETGNDETGGGSDGADGNGDGKSNGNNDDLRKYYELLYNTGLANAEQAKQQALLNAQTQYKEFINPYGTVANQQAALGLQNGGYSEYLQGQAYQGMLNTQNQARSDYSKTQQSLYSDYMGNMAKYNQEQQNKADAVAAAKADLLNNIGNYTSEEALGAALDALGITDAAERQSIIDQWKTAKAEKDAKVQGDNNLTMQAIIDGTADVPPTEENIQAAGTQLGLSQEEIESWKEKLRNKQYAENINPNGDWSADDWEKFFDDARYETLSPEQKEAADKDYSNLIAQASGYDANTGATTTYFTNANGQMAKGDAEKLLNETMNDPHLSQTLKDAIKKEYENTYLKGQKVENVEYVNKAKGYDLPKWTEVKDNATVVDVNNEAFVLNEFGIFNDTVSGEGEQNKYLNAIISAAKANQIPDGSVVIVNYGRNEGDVDAFIYVGDGKFVKLDTSKVENTVNSARFGVLDNVWTPDGYHVYGNTIKKD